MANPTVTIDDTSAFEFVEGDPAAQIITNLTIEDAADNWDSYTLNIEVSNGAAEGDILRLGGSFANQGGLLSMVMILLLTLRV